MQDDYTKYMVKLFSKDKAEIKTPTFISMFIRLSKTIRNKDRKWYQFWKPIKIDNPDYIGNNTEIEFDIKRGRTLEENDYCSVCNMELNEESGHCPGCGMPICYGCECNCFDIKRG